MTTDQPAHAASFRALHGPGRLLILKCLSCGDEYRWDYFADTNLDPHLSGLVDVRRRGADGSTVIEYLPQARSR